MYIFLCVFLGMYMQIHTSTLMAVLYNCNSYCEYKHIVSFWTNIKKNRNMFLVFQGKIVSEKNTFRILLSKKKKKKYLL